MASLNSVFKASIESYSGDRVKTLKVYPDPQVMGTYAIRTSFETGEVQDGLICHYNPAWSVDETAGNLEECEYESWPPKSGGLKFF